MANTATRAEPARTVKIGGAGGKRGRPADRMMPFDWFNYALMLALAVVFIYPFLNILAVSFSSVSAISSGRVTIFPIGFNLKGYEMVFGYPTIWRSYLNTIAYAAVYAVLSLTLTSMLAYTLSVKKFKLRGFLTIYLTITMFFSGGMVPTYLLIVNMKLINTLWAIVLPGCVTAWNCFVYRTFFQGLPESLRESAYIDGANDLVICFRIYIPLSKALLATFGLFAVVGIWNSYWDALLYLTKSQLQPIQMILRQVLFQNGGPGNAFNANDMLTQKLVHEKNVQMACIIATIAPILCAYPFVQKHFAKGVMIGSVKG
jgi:putative aldouronate transport system permease protein